MTDQRQTHSVVTQSSSLVAADGRRIASLMTLAPGEVEARAPLVVLVPPFGLQMRELFAAAYALHINGFRVLRFDARDHVGASDGDVLDFSIESLVADIRLVLAAHPNATLVAISLSALPALQAVAHSPAVRGVVLLTPVVNVRDTLRMVIRKDYWDTPEQERPSPFRVLGCEVRAAFIDSCKRQGYGEWKQAASDLILSANVPVALVAGDRDPWVSFEDVLGVYNEVRTRRNDVSLAKVAAATHHLNRSPTVAVAYLHAMLREAMRLSGRAPALRTIDFAELIAAVGRERVEPMAPPASQHLQPPPASTRQ